MLTLSFAGTAYIFALLQGTVALQVTPGSACAAVCLDTGRTDISDPAASNTFTTDVICKDSDFSETDVGRKYRDCLRCLQHSAASNHGETDQGWFIYNLRFAASSCLFDGLAKSTKACPSESSCSSLQQFLQQDSLDPTRSTWSYCLVHNTPFLGANLGRCVECLRQSFDTKCLANFLIGLQAGCIQRPSPQILIGVDGDIFSAAPAKMANHGIPSNSANKDQKGGLSREAIVGISVGVGVSLLLLTIAIVVYLRKRSQKRGVRSGRNNLHSPSDPRFGLIDITTPNSGGYNNPYSTTHTVPTHQAYTQPQQWQKASASNSTALKSINPPVSQESSRIPERHIFAQPLSQTPPRPNTALARSASRPTATQERATVHRRLSKTNTSQQGNVMDITGPIVKVKHGARFDVDAAERDRVNRLGKEKGGQHIGPVHGNTRGSDSPTESIGEQWPGNY